MFLGEYQHTLDAKGRVSLPQALPRRALTGTVVVAKGFDRCLYVYGFSEYEEFVKGLLDQDLDPANRELRRFFTAGAVPVEVDSAGRIIALADRCASTRV